MLFQKAKRLQTRETALERFQKAKRLQTRETALESGCSKNHSKHGRDAFSLATWT